MLDQLLIQDASCLIFEEGTQIYASRHIGVKPLLLFMETKEGKEPREDRVLVDKVIGKAALLLAKHLSISTIYTPLASDTAMEAAKLHGVALHAKTTVPYIINREKNGLCPLEQSVLNTKDPAEALLRIQDAIAVLMKKNARP